ncbi:MAG: PGPGW domain-containing protein [Gammaproteobacteria bacterium]|nr:PGPGW domain-containing protein [Gammaproteobacteria bacterium]
MEVIVALLDWLEGHPWATGSLVGLSIVTFFGSLLALPWLVARLRADYFVYDHRLHDSRGDRHPAVHALVVVAKNTLGAVLVVAGLAMLVLPGQGLLTILVGLMLMNFPGKYRLEKRLVRNPRVLRALNWMRARWRRPPLQPPPG